MAETERELHEQHQNITRDLAERHARLTALDPEDDAFDEQYTTLMQRAEQLLTFEQQLPAKLAEPQRLRSAQIIRWSWRAQTGVAAALVITVLALGHTGWWLLLLIPHLLATLAGWSIKVTAKKHKKQRGIAIALHAQGVLVSIVALGVIPAWWILGTLAGWALIGGASADETGATK
ncbi:hypothetical protein ACF09G_36215 [Streptomyces albogriseolus]|uniref:hypothetical protein n=1 Tax=Streptomyces albogriseolus TaxID=1887 RepID=UPI003700F676